MPPVERETLALGIFFLQLTIDTLKKEKKKAASWLLTSCYNVDSGAFRHSGRRNLLNVTQQNSLSVHISLIRSGSEGSPRYCKPRVSFPREVLFITKEEELIS